MPCARWIPFRRARRRCCGMSGAPPASRALLDRFGGQRDLSPTRRAFWTEKACVGCAPCRPARRGRNRRPHRHLGRRRIRPATCRRTGGTSGSPAQPDRQGPEALAELQDIARGLPAIVPAVARMAERLSALDAHGIDVGALDFEASPRAHHVGILRRLRLFLPRARPRLAPGGQRRTLRCADGGAGGGAVDPGGWGNCSARAGC